jgi:hypothetical protein
MFGPAPSLVMGVTVTLLLIKQKPLKVAVFTSPADTVVSRDVLPVIITK